MKISTKNSKIIACTIIFITLLLCLFLFFKAKYSRPVLTIGVYTDSSWNVPNGDADRVTKLAIKKFKKKYPNVDIPYTAGIRKNDYNNWLTEKLKAMPDDSLMPCKICCYPAVSSTAYSGFLFKHSDKYAHFCGQGYFEETFYKPLQNGVWSNAIKYSYSSINNKLNSLENRHINEFSSISVNDIDKPSNWSGYGRVLRWGSPSSSDKYYLLIDSNGKLFTGTQLSDASTITWYEK